jgi:hypothetical protein
MMNNTMNDSRSNIERIVMQRVHLIRALRFAISGGVFSTLVSAFALLGIGREVWVARVLHNAPAVLSGLPQFYFEAFLHTRFVVQALVVLTLASLIYVAYEVARAVAVMSERAELS